MSMRSFSPLLPAVKLMQRLRMPVKLSLMGLMLLVPLLLLLVTTYSSTREEIRVAALELDGARQISNLVDLVTQLQTHRDLSNRGLNGDEAAKTQRGAVVNDIKKTLAALTSPDAAEVMNTEPAFWTALQKSVTDLSEGRGPTRRDELFALHTQLVDQVRQQMMLTGEASGLLLDPEATSFFLMDLAVVRIVPWMESLSVARGQGAALLTRGEATNTDRAKMLGHADRVRAEVQDMALRLAALQRSGMAEPAEWASARAASDKFADTIRSVVSAEAITAEPGPYYEQASASITAAVALKQSVVAALTRELEQRVGARTTVLWTKMGVALVGLLLLSYLAWAFYVSFSGALLTLHAGVDKVLGGDLSHQIVLPGRDELSDIGNMVERMNERLSSLVAEIRSSAARVSMSGERVAADSRSLAERTEEQASSLRQAVVTVRQLSDAVAANAAEANQLDSLTCRLRDQAEAGGEAMRASVESMTQLEDGSRRVGEIIGVIDSIAFQTNILALNAAVEAARAGEAGRGFAVVAAEVRTLAQRSASASAEIRGLIARSGEQVELSVKRTRHIGQTLTAVVDGVRAVSTSLQSIAKASAAQSSDLEQVTQSVGSLDEITRSNALMVEASTAAAGELVQRADALQQSVATMRLRQGSADEAETLVQRALKLIKGSSLNNAGSSLHSREQGFVDRDLYIFVIDRQGRYIVHGAKPAMEGKRVHEVPGIDGDRFVREAWAAAQSREGRGGWVEYDIVNNETGAVQPKASFVVALSADLFVGCGIYRRQSMVAA